MANGADKAGAVFNYTTPTPFLNSFKNRLDKYCDAQKFFLPQS